ncbi:urease accessory protein UreD [Gilvimarinus sp. F26214L]|uniref:urease accessory protein UreD n=1 Tax=Gilvimarinus sp. DZF01 TaxID=3461371 RepID=UPI004045A400
MNSLALPLNALQQAEDLHRAGQWQASLDLAFEQRDRGCRLVRNAHSGPLCVQKPFYPEGAELAHVYLLHPPGGLVSGDRLQINVRLNPAAQVLLTTPGAGRVYRARSDRRLQQQINTIDVAAGASMEWLPQETIVYPDAHASMLTQVKLAAESRFTGWEITCLGLPAKQARFDQGSLNQRLLISREQRPVLVENLVLGDATRDLATAAAGMQSCPVSGIFVAGPFASGDDDVDALIHELRERTAALPKGALAGVSKLNDLVVARYLGPCSEQARKLFISIWECVRPVLNQRDARHPRIWST